MIADDPKAWAASPPPRREDWRAFNLNGRAKVRLSAGALALWKERAEGMRDLCPPHLARLWPDAPPVDAEGYWHAPLWEIVRLIGPLCDPGGHPLEVGGLHLDLADG